MKIDKAKPLTPTATGDATARTTARTSSSPDATPSPNETSVSIGSTTAQLRSLESSVAGTPVVDMNKVSEVKQAISDGRFKVNAGVVADRLISSVQDLVNASN